MKGRNYNRQAKEIKLQLVLFHVSPYIYECRVLYFNILPDCWRTGDFGTNKKYNLQVIYISLITQKSLNDLTDAFSTAQMSVLRGPRKSIRLNIVLLFLHCLI